MLHCFSDWMLCEIHTHNRFRLFSKFFWWTNWKLKIWNSCLLSVDYWNLEWFWGYLKRSSKHKLIWFLILTMVKLEMIWIVLTIIKIIELIYQMKKKLWGCIVFVYTFYIWLEFIYLSCVHSFSSFLLGNLPTLLIDHY